MVSFQGPEVGAGQEAEYVEETEMVCCSVDSGAEVKLGDQESVTESEAPAVGAAKDDEEDHEGVIVSEAPAVGVTQDEDDDQKPVSTAGAPAVGATQDEEDDQKPAPASEAPAVGTVRCDESLEGRAAVGRSIGLAPGVAVCKKGESTTTDCEGEGGAEPVGNAGIVAITTPLGSEDVAAAVGTNWTDVLTGVSFDASEEASILADDIQGYRC